MELRVSRYFLAVAEGERFRHGGIPRPPHSGSSWIWRRSWVKSVRPEPPERAGEILDSVEKTTGGLTAEPDPQTERNP